MQVVLRPAPLLHILRYSDFNHSVTCSGALGSSGAVIHVLTSGYWEWTNACSRGPLVDDQRPSQGIGMSVSQCFDCWITALPVRVSRQISWKTCTQDVFDVRKGPDRFVLSGLSQ